MIGWAVVGSMAGFAAIGVLSIGLAYGPVVLCQAIAGSLAFRGRTHAVLGCLAVAVLAACAQIALMLTLIRLISPDASF